MFDSPISKTQAQLVQAARAAATDYIQNGTDLTDAVVKVASDMQPITSEHVRRICEMTYHDAYERLFAEKTGMYQYVSFDPPNAILAAEMLDAIQLGVNQQHNFDKLASKTMKRTTKQRLMGKQASAVLGSSIGAGIGAIGGAISGDKDSTIRQRLGRAVAGGAAGGLLGAGAGKLVSNADEVKDLQKAVGSKQKQVANTEQAANKAVQQADASAAETARLKNVAEENLSNLSKKIDAENIEKATADLPNLEYQVQRRTMNLRDAKQKVIDAGLEGRSSADPDAVLGPMSYGARHILEQAEKAPKALEEAEAALAKARKTVGNQPKNPNVTLEAPKFQKLPETEISRLNKLVADSQAELQFADMINLPQERRAELQKIISESQEKLRRDMQKTASMPRKFQRMNTHEFWMKAASGKELQDYNPTRELQQVHRDLKDSISTVKSELYAAEQNEKLAMIDMVKQAKAGLSAGHSMEQVLHAAVSVVDATEPFMAKTAHDLCATIIEACADHQNSGFRKEASFFRTLGLNPNKEELDKAFADFEKTTGKHRKHMSQKAVYDHVMKQRGMGKEAQMFMGQKEMMNKAKKNSEGWEKNPMKLIYNFDHDKKAAALQEVNPNHPIPQKFKKLAEANIQRKHLEVTLDELNRNMDYYNQRLIDGLTR